MVQFTVDSKVGEIVTFFPKAGDIFKSNRIDFCCGGNISVKDAAEKRKISADELVSTLNSMYEQLERGKKSINWNDVELSDIIAFIQDIHHRFLKVELPQLTPYVTKVYHVHGATNPNLEKVLSLYNKLKVELLDHMEKEENEQFPIIIQYHANPTNERLQAAVNELNKLVIEHEQIRNIFKELRTITNDYTPPKNACKTFRLVYARLEALEEDTFQHIHLENNVLFRRLLDRTT